MPDSLGGVYTGSSAGTLQYSGLTSPTNWVDVVDQLVEIERFNINRLEDWKVDWEDKITAAAGLNTRLLVLESRAGDLDTANEFYARASSTSDTDVLTVTNTSSAVPGAHSVTVGSNIPHKLASQGWADQNTTAIGDAGGDFVINVGTQGTITIDAADITAATTLEGLRDLIKNDAENTGNSAVTASIMDDGSGSNQYRLMITADNGGPDYEISITKNPTQLNFYDNDISPADTTNLTGTTTTTINTLGLFSEDQSTIGSSGYRTYTFTGPASQQTIGSGDWTISWSGDNGGGSGTINLGSSYTAGNTIQIEDGFSISFDSGVFETGSKTFTVKAYSTDIDDPEMDTWSGTSSVTSDGNYLGSTNKTLNFTVSGSDTNTVATDSFDVTWTDGDGNSGTVNVTASSYTDLAVYQGVKVSFGAGTVTGGDTFSIDAFNSTVQAGATNGLAQGETETHSGFVDESTSYVTTTEGAFSYAYGGVTTSVTVDANSTLANLRNLINADTSNPGVTAAIINDGSGLSTAYHLQLIGNDAGAANKIENITHTLDSFATDGTTAYGFSETQTAQNAMVKVDGYPAAADEYLQRRSNRIGDIINGVTLSLVSTGTANVSITSDTSTIKDNIGKFVDSLNAVLDYIKEMITYDEDGDGESNGPMIGNYAFQVVQQRINDILSNPVPGVTDGVDTYTHLVQIGIQTDPDQNGGWVLDSTALSAALLNDIDAVANLFIKNETTGVDGIAELVSAESTSLTAEYSDANPGIVEVLINNYEGIIDNIDDKIEREERRIALVENRLNLQFSRLEVMLGQLQGQQSFLTIMLDSLPSIGLD